MRFISGIRYDAVLDAEDLDGAPGSSQSLWRGRQSAPSVFIVARSRIRAAMWEAAAIVLVALGVFFWLDSLRARERAVAAGRSACERYSLQFLDDTVSISRLRLDRDDEGQLKFARTYTFEFSDTGNNRRHGAIVMLGGELQDVQIEPYPMQ